MSVSSNPPGWVFFYKIITIVIIMIITKILIIMIIITIETIYWTLRFISLSQRLLEIPVSCLQGIVLVSCAGELLYSPGWQSPRDDASIKILVIFAIFWPQNYLIITQKLPSWEFSFHFVFYFHFTSIILFHLELLWSKFYFIIRGIFKTLQNI